MIFCHPYNIFFDCQAERGGEREGERVCVIE